MKNENLDVKETVNELIEEYNIKVCGDPMSDEDMILLRDSILSTIEFAKSIKSKNQK